MNVFTAARAITLSAENGYDPTGARLLGQVELVRDLLISEQETGGAAGVRRELSIDEAIVLAALTEWLGWCDGTADEVAAATTALVASLGEVAA